MDFHIRSGANLPILKVLLITDGRPDFQSVIADLKNSDIFFSLYDVKTGLPKFVNRRCSIVEFLDSNGETKYYIHFQFKTKDTAKEGIYRGEFSISTESGLYVLPLQQELNIYVLDSITSVDTCCPVLVTPSNSRTPTPTPSITSTPTPTPTPTQI